MEGPWNLDRHLDQCPREADIGGAHAAVVRPPLRRARWSSAGRCRDQPRVPRLGAVLPGGSTGGRGTRSRESVAVCPARREWPPADRRPEVLGEPDVRAAGRGPRPLGAEFSPVGHGWGRRAPRSGTGYRDGGPAWGAIPTMSTR
jgi:hypothetical protein